MEMGVIIFVIAALIIAVWVIFGIKRLKHKFLTLFLIALILFSFLSFNIVFKGKDLSINSISDIGKVVKIYFSWLLNAFSNLKIVTTQAIKMNWNGSSIT